MNAMAMLIRREFWEHRMLLIAPLALCGIYLILCVLVGVRVQLHFPTFGSRPPISSTELLIGMQLAFTVLLYLLMAVVAFFYLCDCLYNERKDRSILFWKSLPVSDTMTVLSKAVVAAIAMPLVVYLLSLGTNLIAFALLKVLYHPAQSAEVVRSNWTFLSWMRLNGYLIVDIFVLALWYAPIVGYQLLFSVWAPRAVFVLTLLPPLALVFGERLFFGTWNVGGFLLYRLVGVQASTPQTFTPHGVIDTINQLPLLQTYGLWIGVAVAAVLIFATILIRRHRDDT